jgi:hypothetical protein
MADRYRISPDVLSQEVGGETVLLDLAGETYFGLNEVGTRVWQLLKQDHGFIDLLDVLEAEFDVSRERLETDIAELLDQLEQAGIVERES